MEDGRRRAAVDAIAMMRAIEVVEVQEVPKAAIERGPGGEVVPPECHPPVLGEDRLLQALDEAVGPGMARLDPGVADAQGHAGRIEVGLKLTATVREHA